MCPLRFAQGASLFSKGCTSRQRDFAGHYAKSAGYFLAEPAAFWWHKILGRYL
jgi:hypothetical protein